MPCYQLGCAAGIRVALETANKDEALESGARRFALTLGRATELALLVRAAQHALDHGGDPRPRAAARRFAASRIDSIAAMDAGDARRLANDEA